jgi:hypothetical protein
MGCLLSFYDIQGQERCTIRCCMIAGSSPCRSRVEKLHFLKTSKNNYRNKTINGTGTHERWITGGLPAVSSFRQAVGRQF